MPRKIFDIASATSHPSRGTLRSMPMHFSRNANTGAVQVSFPLELTQARALTPTLALNYHSNQGNSVFGMGFDLSGVFNITRSTRQGGVPRYDDGDIFMLSNAGELVRISDANETAVIQYRPRLDTQFSVIEYHIAHQYWLIKESNGVNHVLGQEKTSQVAHDSRGIYQWWVHESVDALGNKIHYHYDNQLINNRVLFSLASIQYGNYRVEDNTQKMTVEKFAFCCTLDYGDAESLEKNAQGECLWKALSENRPDQFTHYRAGFGIATTQLCRRILLHHTLEGQNYLVKYWNLEYQDSTPLSLLASLQEIGCRANSKNEYITKALPPARFNFFALNQEPVPMQPFDLAEDVTLPGLAGTYQWVDLYRDGLPGILYSDEFTAWYWRSEGQGKFSPPKAVSPFPHDMDFGSSSCRIMHLGNEKKTALVISNEEHTGYYLLDEEKLHISDDQYTVAFSPYQYFTRTPVALADPTNQVMDLTGNGKSDVVVLDALFSHYYPASDSVGEGYEAPKSLTLPPDFPRSHEDANALIAFEDMFGDGLLHRVKVNRNGIAIWPNIGNGCFDEKIDWDLPSEISEDFDPACVFFTDVDGSGACDFVYATKTALLVFLNHGQGFSATPTHTLALPEGYTQQDQLLFGDLLGTGVNSVIFIKKDIHESRHYFGSFAEKKPYLLREMKSSTGVVTTFNYDTSITSYIEDRNKGHLASIRLPFALPVLSDMTVQDPFTQVTIKKTYRYHFGEYNFLERQFCGFAYVEATRHEYIARKESRKEAYSEPIQKALTKSWYYNRAIDEALRAFPRHDVVTKTNTEIGQHYFKRGETTEGIVLKNSPDLLNNIDLNREVQFSLHGQALGHETWGKGSDYFGEDFSAQMPLCVQIEQYNVRCDQAPTAQYQPGIFVIQPREHYRFVYEQQNDVPRISREVNLAFDEKNRVLKKVKLDYGRHDPLEEKLIDGIVVDAATIAKLRDLQNITQALCHQVTYAVTTANDFQCLNLVSEQKTFDLSASTETLASKQTFSDIKTLAQNATQLIQHHQQYYWNETQAGAAPLGQSGPLALIHHQRALLGTENQVKNWYSSLLKTTEAETISSLLSENGYLEDKESHTGWWQPDAIHHYGDAVQYYQLTEIKHMTDYGVSPNQSLFQHITLKRDQYQLAVVQISEALTPTKAFVTTLEIDYQSMEPYQVIDHNHNTHLRLYDPLRQLMAETKYGQLQGEPIGNPIPENFSPTAMQVADLSFTMSQKFENLPLENIIENAVSLLGCWLTVYYYHTAFSEQQPRYSVALTQPQYQKRAAMFMETPKIPETPVGMSIHYMDGFDHPVQIKQRTDEADPNKRWLGSGITLHSRTGKGLRQSLPSFSATAQCDAISTALDAAHALVNEYDAAGELLLQTLPNGDQRQLLRAAWYDIYYDQNVMQNKCNENNANAASISIHFKDAADHPTGHVKIASEGTLNRYQFSHARFDVLGRPVMHQDARLSIPNLTMTYNLLGQKISHESVDRGKETFLHNHQDTGTRRRVGNWSHQTEHDSWQRPLTLNVYSDTQAPVAIETWKYGEQMSEESPENRNAFGQIIQFTNEDSILQQAIFDLEGHCLKSSRSIRLPSMTPNIQKTLENNGAPRTCFDDIASANWQTETFSFEREYDALGNLLTEILPDGRIITHTYNALLQLKQIQSIHLSSLTKVMEMTYQETGFLATRKFGNNIVSHYTYDQQTQRLMKIISRNTATNHLLQDHDYTFDPIGNITRLKLGTLSLPINANTTRTVAENTLDYTYDDYYRLSSAQGMQLAEKTIVSDARVIPQKLFANEVNLAIQTFTQSFAYDLGDNLTGIQHSNTNIFPDHNAQSAWQLDFAIQEHSNQFAALTSTINNAKIEITDEKSLYDAAGNMQKVDEKTDLTWDHTNQLKQFNDTEKNVKEYYAYRGTAFQEVPFTTTQESQAMVPYTPKFFGQAATPKIDTKPFAEYANRLYKISCFEKADKSIEVIEQVFLGNYERKRCFNVENNTASLTLLRHTLRLRDEDSVLATQHVFECDVNAQEANQPILQGEAAMKQWEYHLTDHLHSSLLDLDDQGNVLSIEAYQPYGQIAFIQTRDTQQLSQKDYHYSSQMRDHVSGLYYYGARYYVPQFGRWLAPDPAGLIDGLNVYTFVNGNPVTCIDINGMMNAAEMHETFIRTHAAAMSPHTRKLLPEARNNKGLVENSMDSFHMHMYMQEQHLKSSSLLHQMKSQRGSVLLEQEIQRTDAKINMKQQYHRTSKKYQMQQEAYTVKGFKQVVNGVSKIRENIEVVSNINQETVKAVATETVLDEIKSKLQGNPSDLLNNIRRCNDILSAKPEQINRYVNKKTQEIVSDTTNLGKDCMYSYFDNKKQFMAIERIREKRLKTFFIAGKLTKTIYETAFKASKEEEKDQNQNQITGRQANNYVRHNNLSGPSIWERFKNRQNQQGNSFSASSNIPGK